MKKPTILLDMDNVIADFSGCYALSHYREEGNVYTNTYGPPEMYKPHFFRDLPPLEVGMKLYKALLGRGYNITICTQPVSTNPNSYKEKVEWLQDYCPEMISSLVMTQNKTQIKADFLIDDNRKWESPDASYKFIYFDYHKAKTIDSVEAYTEFILDILGQIEQNT
jgi:5'(3')-deoxyribonucleotidase